MTARKSQTQVTRRRYSPEFKTETLSLAEQVGVAGVVKEFGLHESQFYAWRKKARYEAQPKRNWVEFVRAGLLRRMVRN
ncbi:MAG: transposase [Desulfarculaceae bacterium]|nr:transposase [Desulfarculaceae bacterium]